MLCEPSPEAQCQEAAASDSSFTETFGSYDQSTAPARTLPPEPKFNFLNVQSSCVCVGSIKLCF